MKNINAIHCTIEEEEKEEGNKQQPDSMKNINSTHCPVCNEIINTTKPLLAKDYTVSGETFSIFKCNNCQYGFTHPQPNPNDIGKYYSSPDYSPHANYVKNAVDVLYNVARTFNVKKKVELVKTVAKTQHNIHIADIGCGNGHFLYQCKKAGMIVHGVEVNQHARNNTEQKIKQKVFQSVEQLSDLINVNTGGHNDNNTQTKYTNDQSQMLDVITLWHVLEHLYQPKIVLQQLLKIIKPTGIIIIALPNYQAHDAQHYQQHWAAYDTPRHLSHFTKKTITFIAKQCDAKLIDTIPLKLDALYVSILSEKYKGNNNTIALINGIAKGVISNYYAKKNNEYSSVIYVLQK
jgi:2-polyprenyl-3-methyl-5-hydroxy-6-metoxy-1,4-benzoquinol methylase